MRKSLRREEEGGWGAALLLAFLWAVLPALPALSQGQILGSPLTDLYPSVWGLDGFAAQQPGLPLWTDRVAAPGGMGFYYSSPLHGWLGTPLWGLFGPVVAYNVTLLLARFATVAAGFGAFRAIGLGPRGALCAAGIYGASPFFHGYSVEGIVEGTDGWTLALWAWAVVRRHTVASALAFALTVASSWYLGMVACLLAVGWGLRERGAWISMGAGLLLSSPFLYGFLTTMTGAAPLESSVRVAMGSSLIPAKPGWWPGLNPFAMTSFLGLSTLGLGFVGARERPGVAIGAGICFLLSFGVGPWYWLPVMESIRFPYRWHAGTLFCAAILAGTIVDRLKFAWLAWLPAIEGLLLGPIEPIIPGAPSEIPKIYDAVQGPLLLEVPGPLAMPPGEPNFSRPRSRYLLYAQTLHGAASPWAPDFNGVAEGKEAPFLQDFRACDPLYQKLHPDATCGPFRLGPLKAAGVTQVMVHRDELRSQAAPLEQALIAAGATLQQEQDTLALYRIP
ncbi:MAG TPA: hypothetical protein PKW90_07655 [Myxococcota bacterium]|nr:hypothetical protein [Myxococcota bacterium]